MRGVGMSWEDAEQIALKLAEVKTRKGTVGSGDLHHVVQEVRSWSRDYTREWLGDLRNFVRLRNMLRQRYADEIREGFLPVVIVVRVHSMGPQRFAVVIEARDELRGARVIDIEFAACPNIALETAFKTAKECAVRVASLGHGACPVVHLQPLQREARGGPCGHKLTVSKIKKAMAVSGLDKEGGPLVLVSPDFGEIDLNASWSLQAQDEHPDDPEMSIAAKFSGTEIRRLMMAPFTMLGQRAGLRYAQRAMRSAELVDAGIVVTTTKHKTLHRNTTPMAYPVLIRPTSLGTDQPKSTLWMVMGRGGRNATLSEAEFRDLTAGIRALKGSSSDLCLTCVARQDEIIRDAFRSAGSNDLRRMLVTAALLATAAQATVPTLD